MKSAYEIAWNLIEDTLESSENIHKITGVPLWKIDKMKFKSNLLAKVFRFEDNLPLIKELIEEIEQKKPHYLVEDVNESLARRD